MKKPKRITVFGGLYEFLSNFYPCEIRYLGHTYRSVEHAYQAAKTHNPMDHLRIAGFRTAKEAKQWGRTLTCLRPDWEEVKVSIMKTLIKKKFKADSPLAEKLLGTGDAMLIEGNWWGDEFWGKCRGKGKNMLGKLLMRRRKKLRNLQ